MRNTISKSSEILNIRRNGLYLSCGCLRVFYNHASCFRVCIIISRIIGNAVRRNKIRRWIRHILCIMRVQNISLVIQIDRETDYSYDNIYYALLASLSKIDR